MSKRLPIEGSTTKRMQIPVLRSGEQITNLPAALGSLKETRLTAFLAYLMGLCPQPFTDLFLDESEKISRILIEYAEYDGRYDIVLEGIKTTTIIEAKTTFEQSRKQITKYISTLARRKGQHFKVVLLDVGSKASSYWMRDMRDELPPNCQIDFVSWNQVLAKLRWVLKSKYIRRLSPFAQGLAADIITHLKENAMVKEREGEIYVRDMSGRSVELFFRHRIYRSQPKFYNSAKGNLYFSPIFTHAANLSFAGHEYMNLRDGLSYIAKIRHLEIVPNKHMKEFLMDHDHPNAAEAAKFSLKGAKHKTLLVLLLDRPHRLFLTPLTKTKLNIHGATGSRSFTLDRLLTAAESGR